MTVQIEYVEHHPQDHNDFFGNVVARSDVRGMTEVEIEREIDAMRLILGPHVSAVRVEEVPAITHG